MKSSKKKLLGAAVAVIAAACGTVAWQLVPPSADALPHSTVIVERTTWQEVTVDGKPQLYFSAAQGDSVLLGVTANRDSAIHRSRTAGCWVNRWMLLPSCAGRIATVNRELPAAPHTATDSSIVKLCRASIATQLKTLKAQKTELDYYLRVHGVQDNGYQTIAALATRIDAAYADVARAGRTLDSLAADKRHRLALKAMCEYTAVYRDTNGKTVRTSLRQTAYDPKAGTMLLQTADGKTPDGATPLSHWTWSAQAARDIRAVGYPGLGEPGLECDTVTPVVMAGRRTGNRHNLPGVLVSDGAPIFTAKGRFIGLVSGDKIQTAIKTGK